MIASLKSELRYRGFCRLLLKLGLGFIVMCRTHCFRPIPFLVNGKRREQCVNLGCGEIRPAL